MKIVSVGEITLDHYVGLKKTFVGGISLNFAVHAKRAGAQVVSLISRVGSQDGQVVLDQLEREDVNATHVETLAGKTACIDILVLENADRIFPEGSYHENTLADFSLSQEEIAFIQQHDTLVTFFAYLQQLKDIPFSGKRVIDFGDWSSRQQHFAELVSGLRHCDLAFISGTQETIKKLLPYATENRLIVVTLGANGSAALRNGTVQFQEAIQVSKPVDATGCGDAFQGAFTVHYFTTGDIKESLSKGSQQATRVLQHYGAT